MAVHTGAKRELVPKAPADVSVSMSLAGMWAVFFGQLEPETAREGESWTMRLKLTPDP